MKFISLCLLLSFCPAFGQTSVSDLLSQGLKPDESKKPVVSAEDQKALVTATATLLSKHLTFRADGSASAFYSAAERQTVEWQKFVVFRIDSKPVSEADKLNGITKKYAVIFGCDANRTWDAKANRWGEWQPNGYADFPLGVVFHLKGGAWTAEAPDLLKYFSPGPGPSISDSKPKPAGKTAELPPGMQKMK
ncbi:MAG: hypothetical protein V4727_02230 [Verrucomicrobiota bacterium]